MYSLTVCDHIMIAHSFQGEEFGPAQRMHGATFAVEAEFRAPALDHHQLLVDIGLAKTRVAARAGYRRLQQPGRKSVAEGHQYDHRIHGVSYSRAARRRLRRGAARGMAAAPSPRLKILLREAPTAWAAYEGPLNAGGS